VADAMTGQDAIKSAASSMPRVRRHWRGPDEGCGGDARTARGGAGAACPVVLGGRRPIAFVEAASISRTLEPFHPDRVAPRVLGMGDVLSPIEKGRAAINQDGRRAARREDPARTSSRSRISATQLKTIKKMGPLEHIMGMHCPGWQHQGARRGQAAWSLKTGRSSVSKAIINSMTPDERRKQHIINAPPARCKGQGTSVEEVNRL